MFKLDTTKRRVALLAFALALGTVGVLAGSGALFGSNAAGKSASWRLLPRAPVTFDAGETSVWTGKDLIVSGLTGAGIDGNLLEASEAALAYNPADRSWRRLADPPETDTYCHRHAVWTGREMLVWGCSLLAYDPATDQWRRLPQPPSGAGIAVWTGRELLGWGGGCCGDSTARGEAFDPDTETWRAIAESPLAPEQQPLGAWTGRELVLFVSGISAVDGKPLPPELARAAAYDPATDTWRRVAPLPERRVGATAVWDGSEVLIVGGRDESGALARAGLAYNPTANDWRRLAIEPGRTGAVAAWTGSRLLVWGGDAGRTALEPVRGGLSFDPVSGHVTQLPPSPLEGRTDAVGAWTGRELIVWGGFGAGNRGNVRRLEDGAALAPGDWSDDSDAVDG